MATIKVSSLWSFLLSSLVSSQVLFMPQNDFLPSSGQVLSFPVDLSSLYNNRAFGMKPNESNFDGMGGAFPAQYMPSNSFIYSGVNYDFATYKAAGNDNVVGEGQVLSIPRARYSSVQMLASSQKGMAQGTINATYADGTTNSGPVLVPAWWSWPYPAGGDLVFPYYFTNQTTDYNRSNIFQTINWLDSSKDLVSLTLPNVTGGSATDPGAAALSTKLHIFSLSLTPAACVEELPHLEINYARSTNKWIEGTNKTQIVEVDITNIGSAFVLRNNTVRISVDSPGLYTVQPGVINRLRPGDRATVEIGVINKPNVTAGSFGNATIVVDGCSVTSADYAFNATYGFRPFDPTYDSVYNHETPDWYNNAKYGIFIHWGVYAVPGWGNVGKLEQYAEWYWWYLNQGHALPVDVYDYHLRTYGPNKVYDDFIANFTASAFNPKDWVDLFADAGANYFVQVSKHHDGYAIFDLPANVTKRTSVAQFPHRNLLQELFDAAKQYQPQLHRATYYSLPEWFHPDYARYGFGSWPGGNATNPFTNVTLPYTGYVPVKDYITDVINPEMNALADMGTEIMWCDIGGPNMTAQWASEWFNSAAAQGRQVSMNARCGLPGDFDTPEYARYAAVQRRKWESNLGMDPYSYGYNRATPLASYLNASSIVTSLVDIVSKNGNFLLDVGPTANGTIIEIEQQNLRAAGKWIKEHGEAIFNTTYWFVTPQEGDNVRFTQTTDAFYVLCMARPNASLVLHSPVPWVEGDNVTVVGGNMSGTLVPSMKMENGSVMLNVTDVMAAADRYTWVFKITY